MYPKLSGFLFSTEKMIKISQMSAAAVYHKAQYLFEKLKNRKTLFILSNGAEKPVNHRKNLDTVQIRYKQCQSGSTAQFLTGRTYFVNLQFTIAVFFAILAHRVLHLLGLIFLVFVLVAFNKYTDKLTSGEGLFLLKIRLA
ncbi:MAG: hypothetical protein WBM78_22345 [Desulfobacterales bacterium]